MGTIAWVIGSSRLQRKGDENVLETSEDAQKPIGLSKKHFKSSNCMARGTLIKISELGSIHALIERGQLHHLRIIEAHSS